MFGIIVTVFFVTVIIILGLCIYADVLQSRKYRNSPILLSEIIESQGRETVRYYGRYGLRSYGRYLVRISTGTQVWEKQILLRDTNLKDGDAVQIHYTMVDGEPEVLNDISARRVNELAIASIVAIPLCAVLVYLKSHGLI